MPVVNNLSDLLVNLRANVPNSLATDSLEYLQELVGNDIKIRWEICESNHIQNTAPVAREGRFSSLHEKTLSRVLLTSDRCKSDFSREIVRLCNGLVLDSQWNVKSLPSQMFNPKYKKSEISKNISEYNIYKIEDGTTVTLYYDKKWCLSTTNGFDVSNYQWMGNYTYWEAFMDVAKLYPKFNLDSLDRNTSYTIGFRHHEFHPLNGEKNKMWLVQSCNLSKLNEPDPVICVDRSPTIGIPVQIAVNFDKSIKLENIMKYLINKNNAALDLYLKSDAEKNIHYGYVLRCHSSNVINPAFNNVVLESELLKTIRTLIYNLPRRNAGFTITAPKRKEYVALRSYLNITMKTKFMRLFPQLAEKYDYYDSVFAKLLLRVLSLLRKRNNRDSLNDRSTGADELSNRINLTASNLIKDIEQCKINPLSPYAPNIVEDYLMRNEYLELYSTCLFN